VDLVVRQATDTLWWSLGRLRARITVDIRHVYDPLLIIFFAVVLFHPGGLTKALPRRYLRSRRGCRHGRAS
jgi:hypothetical protein